MVVKPPRTKQMKHSIPRGQRDIGSSDEYWSNMYHAFSEQSKIQYAGVL